MRAPHRPGSESQYNTGEDEAVIQGASSCLGEFSRFCTEEAFTELLREGPLAHFSGTSSQKLAAGLILASVGASNPARS